MKEELKRQLIVSALTAIAVAIINNALSEINLIWLVVAFIGSFGLLQLYQLFQNSIKHLDIGRQKGIQSLTLVGLLVALLGIWDQWAGPELSAKFIRNSDVILIITSHRWISYDPMQFDPDVSLSPGLTNIDQELDWVKNAGFDGIITFSSRGTFSSIPKIARQKGFSVIMGVWDPKDETEIRRAISAREYVDAYAVGHNGLDTDYSFEDLGRATRVLRFRTGRPVSTTEKIGRYLSDDRLLNIGDWIFPDIHVLGTSNKSADARRDAQETIKLAKQIADKVGGLGKPILLKMVSYPMDGIPNASLTQQARFFTEILDNRRDALPQMPVNVYISVHGVFDTPWKSFWPFYEWDPYTGLFDNTGKPRLAVPEIIQRLP